MIIAIILVLLGCLYIIRNLYNKLLKLEELVASTEENQIKLLTGLITKFTEVKQRLERVDKRGSFASDDEVGFVFRIIKLEINELVDSLNRIIEDGESQEGNK